MQGGFGTLGAPEPLGGPSAEFSLPSALRLPSSGVLKVAVTGAIALRDVGSLNVINVSTAEGLGLLYGPDRAIGKTE